jgi:hypothetical protein
MVLPSAWLVEFEPSVLGTLQPIENANHPDTGNVHTTFI